MNEWVKGLLYMLVLVAVGVALLILRRRGLSGRAQSMLLGLVAEAEATFGAGTGKIKFSSVLSRLYAALPAGVQFLFSEETVAAWIENALAQFKALTEGKPNSK